MMGKEMGSPPEPLHLHCDPHIRSVGSWRLPQTVTWPSWVATGQQETSAFPERQRCSGALEASRLPTGPGLAPPLSQLTTSSLGPTNILLGGIMRTFHYKSARMAGNQPFRIGAGETACCAATGVKGSGFLRVPRAMRKGQWAEAASPDEPEQQPLGRAATKC